MAYGESNGDVTDASGDPQKCCDEVRSAILATAWLLVFIQSALKVYSACCE